MSRQRRVVADDATLLHLETGSRAETQWLTRAEKAKFRISRFRRRRNCRENEPDFYFASNVLKFSLNFIDPHSPTACRAWAHGSCSSTCKLCCST